MSSNIHGEISRLRQALADLARFNELEATLAICKKNHDETVSAIDVARKQQESQKIRLSGLSVERSRRARTREYWPVFVITIPYATLIIVAGFWAII